MEIRPFTLDELERMLSDYCASDPLKHDEASEQKRKVLLQNKVNIAKQLFSTLKTDSRAEANPDYVTAEELEGMIANYESYWKDRFGRGDSDAEEADVLPRKIMWITMQLIETMKLS